MNNEQVRNQMIKFHVEYRDNEWNTIIDKSAQSL